MLFLSRILLLALGALALSAAPVGFLDQVSPTPTFYIQDVDFMTLLPNPFTGGTVATGVITASVYDIHSIGCSASDYPGGLVGQIAMVDRGSCLFSSKTNFAEAAGAVGILIVNNVASLGGGGAMTDPTGIVALLISQSLGADFRDIQATGAPLMVRIEVIPEPATWLLFGGGLVVVAVSRRLRRG
jgi:hypothetical protein